MIEARAGVLLMAMVLAACAPVPPATCAAGEQMSVSDMLYFGTVRPGGVVSTEEWAAFLADTVTPRFPQGLSVWAGSGQWRSADGSLTRENSFVLNIVHPGDPVADASMRAIASEYKARFHQEAVLRVKSRVCVSF